MNRESNFTTRQIHGEKIDKDIIRPLVTPIYQTSTFTFRDAAHGGALFAGEEDGFFYTRIDNPNSRELAKKVADLENADAGVCFSSGLGAVTGVIWTLLSKGDHLIADKTLYGCTFEFFEEGLPRFGIDVDFIDLSKEGELEKYLRKETKVIYLESPANPNLKIVDIEKTAKLAHNYNSDIKVVVDNTFCTPYLQRPMELGADVVLHSATKYLNGHGDVIAGIVVGKQEVVESISSEGLRYLNGSVLGPFEAWLIMRGIKTLSLRMERHCANAMKVAEFLDNHPKVDHVYYPGLQSHPQHELAKKQMKYFGAMISFEVKGGKEDGERCINNCKLANIAVSLGDAETLIQHPATMTHCTYNQEALANADISEKMVRISVGLEDVEDIIADLKQALEA